jgi:hypothetical protein
MECPQQISFEITNLELEEQNISQLFDCNEELNLMKKTSFEEFIGKDDESTEISLLLTSLDSNSTTIKEEETESVSEILAILKKTPNSTKNKTNNNYINPFGVRPVKKVSLSGKVLCKPFPERVNSL